MKTRFLCPLLALSLVLTPALRADELPAPSQPPVEMTDEEPLPAGKEVSKNENNERKKAARRRMWQNIGLAVGAIAVAVTCIVLASRNNGHGK